MQDADDRGAPPAHLGRDAGTETQVGDRRNVAPPPQRRADVLEPERLDAEEGTEAEALVAGIGPQEQDVHRVQRGL